MPGFPSPKPTKKVAAIALASLLLGGLLSVGLPGFSQSKFSVASFYNCTREESIVKAFELMAESSGEQSLSVIINTPIRVIFKDLATLDKRVKNYDALSYMTANGHLMIYINQKHANAPVAAIAAILSHEAMHHDAHNSLAEEIAGWTQEARLWREMKQRNPQLSTIRKGQYPLVDRLNVLETHYQNGTMTAFVREQAGYKGLPETSPGFETN